VSEARGGVGVSGDGSAAYPERLDVTSTISGVSWPWIVLLGAAAVIVVAAEWPRLSGLVGADARRRRERERRKAKFRVVRDEDEEFVASVQRDLDRLPTIEEHESRRRD